MKIPRNNLSSIKYKVNYNPVVYDYRSGNYHVGDSMYRDYQKAKANQWKCEKCGIAFASFRELRTHKVEDHSY